MMLVWLFGVIFVTGPVGGAAYALASDFTVWETVMLVSLMHLALVPVWLAIFHFLRYEFHQRQYLVQKLAGRTRITKSIERAINKNLIEFQRKLKRWSLGTAVFGLTFLFGLAWAVLIATLLKIEQRTILLPLAFGAVVSSVVWSFALGVVGFFLDPWVLYLALGVMTFAALTHGKLHEREMLREMSRSLKRLSFRMEKYTVLAKPKKR
jgi:hypothetical protein